MTDDKNGHRPSEASPAEEAWPTCVYGQCPNPHAPNSMFCSECLIRRERERQEHDQRSNEAKAPPAGECHCDCAPCLHGQHHGPYFKCGIEELPDAPVGELTAVSELQRMREERDHYRTIALGARPLDNPRSADPVAILEKMAANLRYRAQMVTDDSDRADGEAQEDEIERLEFESAITERCANAIRGASRTDYPLLRQVVAEVENHYAIACANGETEAATHVTSLLNALALMGAPVRPLTPGLERIIAERKELCSDSPLPKDGCAYCQGATFYCIPCGHPDPAGTMCRPGSDGT